MVLSEKQKADLNLSILDYLKASGYSESLAAFEREAAISIDQLDPKAQGLLEKKWTSVVRLQKKVIDLEAQLATAQTESRAGPVSLKLGGGAKDYTTWIPRSPAKYEVSGHRMPITAVLFHPVFTVFVTASEDATMKIYDYESGQYERTLKGHTNSVQDIAFDKTGTTMASCSADMTIKLWNFEAFECIKTLRGHDHNISSVTFTPAGDYLVSASRDKTIKIWETSTGFNIKTIEGHSDWVRKARLSPDGSLLCSAGNDQTVRVWSFSTKDVPCKFEIREHEHVIETLEWAPVTAGAAINTLVHGEGAKGEVLSGPFFATASRDKSIKLFDASTGQCLFTFLGHDNWVRALRFHPGGKYLLSSSDDKTIRIWDLAAKRCFKTLEAHAHFVSCLDMHPTAPVVVSGSVDMTAKVWECS